MMRSTTLLRRSFRYYWRTNLAVIAGVGVAVAVLSGALLVGESVRASLRDLVLQRLGRTDRVVLSSAFFREQLSASFAEAAPLVALEGLVTEQGSGRRASRVQVYGVDERFWRFHGLEPVAIGSADALISEGLASEVSASAGGSIVLRVETGAEIPIESLHGRKEDVGRSLRLTVAGILPREMLGEFSLAPRQGVVRALFLPLGRVQRLLGQPGRVNTVLLAGGDLPTTERRLREAATLEDIGLNLKMLPEHGVLALASRSTIITDALGAAAVTAAERLGMSAVLTLSHLANVIRSNDREIPYSVITAVDLQGLGLTRPDAPPPSPDAIFLNQWAAQDLGARPSDRVSIEYYVWESEGRLSTRTADFVVAGIVPIAGSAADRDLVPEYPGITNTARLADWDPPFPIDLRRVRPRDEEYWSRYRTTPKAFISIERGQALWRSRYGGLTALRIVPGGGTPVSDALAKYGEALRASIDPLDHGFAVYDVRAQSLAASAGATDFGEYFTYFSTFLVVAALLLAGLFFRLGVEQRLQQIGLLQAVGLDPAAIRRLFVAEGIVLSVGGAIAGTAGAVAYAATIMYGLRTWWVDAVGTTALTLEVEPGSLVIGAVAVVAMATASIWWSLRSLRRVSARSLLTGGDPLRLPVPANGKLTGADRMYAGAFAVAAVILVVAASAGLAGQVAGFFGAGALSLMAMLLAIRAWLRSGTWGTLQGHGTWAVWRLGFRNATHRPTRSVLCIALIAFATFVITSVEGFKREDVAAVLDRHSGGGGYPLLLESLLPIVHDLNAPTGQDAMNLAGGLEQVHFDPFRVRPGEDASCLNLYQPKNPRILAATPAFISAGRFAFHSSLAETPEEEANPWLLLNRQFEDGAIPVIADANSMTYVLHMKLGDDFLLPGTPEKPIRLRLVAALADSIFQSELVMAEAPFLRVFPDQEGYRFFLVDAPPGRAEEITALLESRLGDFGADVASTADRLAGFHRVEYTYLSTFQMLGGLGLVLGTLGLGAVLLRNVLERRRELALLRALGYRRSDFFAIVMAENVLLLACGLIVGVSCAAVAIAPVLVDRGGTPPGATLSLLLAGVFVTGLLGSIAATVGALRSPLLAALRTE